MLHTSTFNLPSLKSATVFSHHFQMLPAQQVRVIVGSYRFGVATLPWISGPEIATCQDAFFPSTEKGMKCGTVLCSHLLSLNHSPIETLGNFGWWQVDLQTVSDQAAGCTKKEPFEDHPPDCKWPTWRQQAHWHAQHGVLESPKGVI